MAETAKRKTGRPPVYTLTPELEQRILDGITDGLSLREVCSADGMPDRSVVVRWVEQDESFAAKYARARELQGDAVDDDMVGLTRKVLRGEIDPQSAKVVLGNMQWRAERLAPKKYGARQQVDQNVDMRARLAIVSEFPDE